MGDAVKQGQVLASIDKREFFQELAQAENKIEKTRREIAKESEKSTGTEASRMEREIDSMERKLQEMENELTKMVQNSPDKGREKILDINAKKRELQEKKEKYDLDTASYEKEFSAREITIENKINSAGKLLEETVRGSSTEFNDLRDGLYEINKLFAFERSELTDSELYFAESFRANNTGHEPMIKDLWREARRERDSYRTLADAVNRDSYTTKDANTLIEVAIRAYQKLLEATDMTRKMADSVPVGDGAFLSRSELSSVNSALSALRTKISAKISSLKESRENIVLVDSPEKIREKVLSELNAKKIALEASYDAIARLEMQIAQNERETIVEGDRVIDLALKNEIADKQSAILNQKDSIQTKKEELVKLKSGKSDALENLQTTLKDQIADLQKMKTKEESYEIRAPFSGTVRSIKFKVGDIIGGGGTSDNSATEKVLLLENSDIINIKASLNQLDIIKVKMKQKADLFFEAIPDATLSGEITEISSTPSSDGGSGFSMYEVIISALRENYPIYSGMNASVTIPMDENTEALLVPTTAISDDANTGENYVNVVQKDGSIKKTMVKTGKTNGRQTEIVSGLSEGQEIQVIDFDANEFKPDDFSGGGGFF